MGTVTQLTTFVDLYTDLQNRAREETGVSATENQAKRYINIALHDMYIGRAENFPWLERSNTILTQPSYTTGTVTINKGDTTLEGASSPAWSTNNDFGVANVRAGGKITIAGALDVYEVSNVTDADTLELTGRYVGEDVAAVSYTYFEDEYTLAFQFLRPLDLQYFSDSIPIELISRMDFRRKYPINGVPGHPTVATIIDKEFDGSASPIRKVRFHPPPDAAYNIPYSYVTENVAVGSDGVIGTGMTLDDSEPNMPLRYRHAIVFHALYHWYRDKKNDQRAQEAKAEYEQILLRIANDTEIGGRHASIRVRRGAYVRRAKRPWRGGGRRFDTNGEFDRMEI
jgi:hypothetical protein